MATQAQIQHFVDTRLRPRAEQIRDLLVAMQDDRASIDDVYATLVANSAAWVDSRPDGPPNLLTGNDVLSLNSALFNLVTAINGLGDLTTIHKACVRPVLEG